MSGGKVYWKSHSSTRFSDLKSDSEFIQSQTDQSDQETEQMEALEKWTWNISIRHGRFRVKSKLGVLIVKDWGYKSEVEFFLSNGDTEKCWQPPEAAVARCECL